MEISTRKPYFIEEEDDEIASSPSSYNNLMNIRKINQHKQYSYSSPRSVLISRKSQNFIFGFDNSYYGQPLPHFLDSCFLCKKRLSNNKDIFMYRGDTPFCSEECREEEIERDEAKEKKQNLSSSLKAMRRNEKRNSSSSPTRSRDYGFNTGTVVTA